MAQDKPKPKKLSPAYAAKRQKASAILGTERGKARAALTLDPNKGQFGNAGEAELEQLGQVPPEGVPGFMESLGQAPSPESVTAAEELLNLSKNPQYQAEDLSAQRGMAEQDIPNLLKTAGAFEAENQKPLPKFATKASGARAGQAKLDERAVADSASARAAALQSLYPSSGASPASNPSAYMDPETGQLIEYDQPHAGAADQANASVSPDESRAPSPSVDVTNSGSLSVTPDQNADPMEAVLQGQIDKLGHSKAREPGVLDYIATIGQAFSRNATPNSSLDFTDKLLGRDRQRADEAQGGNLAYRLASLRSQRGIAKQNAESRASTAQAKASNPSSADNVRRLKLATSRYDKDISNNSIEGDIAFKSLMDQLQINPKAQVPPQYQERARNVMESQRQKTAFLKYAQMHPEEQIPFDAYGPDWASIIDAASAEAEKKVQK